MKKHVQKLMSPNNLRFFGAKFELAKVKKKQVSKQIPKGVIVMNKQMINKFFLF